jgi:hypothetical protein
LPFAERTALLLASVLAPDGSETDAYKALAITSLEQSIMWIVKVLTS